MTGGTVMVREWPTRDLVGHRADATPEREALVDAPTGEAWTYRDLDGWVGRIAATLQDRGAFPGRFAVLSRPRPEVVALFHAGWRTGRELVPLNVELAPEDLAAQIESVDAGVVLADEPSLGVAEDAMARDEAGDGESAREVGDVVVRGLHDVVGPAKGPASTTEPGSSDPASKDSVARDDAVSRDDVPVTLFTSGSTGDPKAVRLTVGNLMASATASAFRLGVSRDDRWLSPLPTYHMGGLAPIVRCALYGATVVLQREFDAAQTADALAASEATGVSLVPTALSRLLDGGWQPDDSLRFVLLGGAAADHSLLERCEDHDVPVHPSYGMTETASQIATATPAQAFADPDTVGQPLVNTTVTVVDDDGKPVARGDRGELAVAGPTVTPGYLHGDGASFSGHGFHTGDRGYRDDDGTVYVIGRLDETIVTGGENVQPARVAAALEAQESVAAAAVVGLTDDEWGERVAALLVPQEKASIDVDAVVERARERLPAYALPKTVAVADAIPRTASGTVDRDAVRENLADEADDRRD